MLTPVQVNILIVIEGKAIPVQARRVPGVEIPDFKTVCT
jgi:hypothetical protein